MRSTRLGWRVLVQRWKRETRGSGTVEFVLWVPAFMVLLLLTVDTCLFLLESSRMTNAGRDAVRQMSLGELEVEDGAATTYVGNLLGKGYTARTVRDGDTVALIIEHPVADVVVTDWALKPLMGENLTTTTIMRMEPGL